MATYKLKRKSFGFINTKALKTAGLVGGGLLAAGTVIGAGKLAKTTNDALTGQMGEENGAGF